MYVHAQSILIDEHGFPDMINQFVFADESFVQPGQKLFHLMSQEKFSAMGGGAPLVHDGEFVGGIGVSGRTVAQDMEILEGALTMLAPLRDSNKAAATPH